MRTHICILALFIVALAPGARASETPDSVLTDGLNASLTNGLEAMLRIWYSDRPALAAEMKEELFPLTRNLGEIFDTEIVATQTISQRVTRFYVALYFTRRPVWLRVERYANRDKTFYFPLRFSIHADDILPGYITGTLPATDAGARGRRPSSE